MMWENLIIHALLGILAGLVKNPHKAAELKGVLLQVQSTITDIYPTQ